MKAVPFLFGSLFGLLSHAQTSVLINEIQASNQATIFLQDGRSPDWIEIYNPTIRTVDLIGMRLAVNGDQAVIDASMKIAPRGHKLLWCDGRPE
ncbi:MAG: lamin tail domain-containing protein, partial [Bacteroidota bacterium]|nr:lamin tail domain-containing protein [Bacteroidota bacterium]